MLIAGNVKWRSAKEELRMEYVNEMNDGVGKEKCEVYTFKQTEM